MKKLQIMRTLCAFLFSFNFVSIVNADLITYVVTLTPQTINIHEDDPDGSVFGFTSLPSATTVTFIYDDSTPNPVPFGEWNMDSGSTWFPLTMETVDGAPSVNFNGSHVSADFWDTYQDSYIRVHLYSHPPYYTTGSFYMTDCFDRGIIRDRRSSISGIQTVTILSQTVPVPGALWLLGSGLIGVVGLRRKFSNK